MTPRLPADDESFSSGPVLVAHLQEAEGRVKAACKHRLGVLLVDGGMDLTVDLQDGCRVFRNRMAVSVLHSSRAGPVGITTAALHPAPVG